MHIFSLPEGLLPGWVTFRSDPFSLKGAFLVKGTFKMGYDLDPELDPEGDPPCGDRFEDEDPTAPLVYASDFVPYKPRADLLVQGTVHTPGGRPQDNLLVEIRAGNLNKRIVAVGDRFWKPLLTDPGARTDPKSFTSMPLSYRFAYGAPEFDANPAGCGWDTQKLPNFEYPERIVSHPKQVVPPAGLGPLSPQWAPRSGLVGTYDDAWLREHWPWYPADLDYAFFNAAPIDQQFSFFPHGDESISITNMHPLHKNYKSRLPGLRVRLFINEDDFGGQSPSFREVPLHIDTVTLDMDKEKMFVVWRGLTQVRHVKLKEVKHLLIASEPLTAEPLPFDEYRKQLHICLNPPDEERTEAAVVLPPFGTDDAVDAEMMEMDRIMAEIEAESIELETQWDAEVSQRAKLHNEPDLASKLAASPSDGPLLSKLRVAQLNEYDPALAKEYQTMVRKIEEGEAEIDAMVREFDTEFGQPEPTPDEILQQFPGKAGLSRPISGGEALSVDEDVGESKTELSGAILAGADLRGVDFSEKQLQEANFRNANLQGALFLKAQLQEAQFDGADLRGADFSDANLDDASFSGAKMDRETIFRRASMINTDFSEIDLSEGNFREVKGFGIDFSNAKLMGADFEDAVLRQSDFSEADISGAIFRNADMYGAQMEEANARGCDFEGARIDVLHGSDGTDFSNSLFLRVSARGSIWEDSVLDSCVIEEADFSDSQFAFTSMQNLRAKRAHFTNAIFDDANATGACFEYCNLLRTSFERSNLKSLQMVGCNAYEASFADAVKNDDTRFNNCNLKKAAGIKP